MSMLSGARVVPGGRKGAAPPQVEFERPVTAADRETLATTPKGSKAPALKRIRDTHHALAKLLVEGFTDVEAAAATGYSPSRISILRGDPSFQELMEYYRSHRSVAYRDLHERLSVVAGAAADEIMERLEDAPEDIPMETLVNITKMGADRTGHGPQTKNAHVHLHVGQADRLARARERVARMAPEGNPHVELLPAPEPA